jgi:hypothetical protein
VPIPHSSPSHPLGFFVENLDPPLVSIKGEGKEFSEDKTNVFSTSAINISSNTPLYSSLETWDRFPLSQLVTPTQALRCKEIQYSPPLLDVGPPLPKPG